MYCNNCGKPIPDNSQFCNHCGSEIQSVTESPKQKNKMKPLIIGMCCMVLAVAAILVGVFVVLPAVNQEKTTEPTESQPNSEYLALFEDAQMVELEDTVTSKITMTYAKAIKNGGISKVTVGYDADVIKEMIVSVYLPRFDNVLDGVVDYYIEKAEDSAKDFEFCEVKVITRDDCYVIRTSFRKLDTIKDGKAFLVTVYPGNPSHYEDGIITVTEFKEYLTTEEFIKK